jgi:hypothetical protein
MHFKNFSRGMPLRSYMANMNHGNITTTITNAAALVGANVRKRKNNGIPVAAAAPKHTVCRLVSPSKNFVRTRVKSFGIDT